MDRNFTSAPHLRRHGLKITRQRLVVADWIFSNPYQHVTAQSLHRSLAEAGETIALSSVYNILGSFAAVGLVRCIAQSGTQMHYDTNPTPHHHFHDHPSDQFVDIPAQEVEMSYPSAPSGYVVQAVDVILHLRRAGASRQGPKPLSL